MFVLETAWRETQTHTLFCLYNSLAFLWSMNPIGLLIFFSWLDSEFDEYTYRVDSESHAFFSLYTPLGVCIIATARVGSINSAFLINSFAFRAHWFLYYRSTPPKEAIDTCWQEQDRWVGLTKHQEGWKKVGAHCLDMDKLVRRTRNLALATSYTHKLVVHINSHWCSGQ